MDLILEKLVLLNQLKTKLYIQRLPDAVKYHHHELINNFSVLNNNGLRIKRTPKK